MYHALRNFLSKIFDYCILFFFFPSYFPFSYSFTLSLCVDDINVYEQNLELLLKVGDDQLRPLIESMAASADALTANPLDSEACRKISLGKDKLKRLFRIGADNEVPGLLAKDVNFVIGLEDNRKIAKKCGSTLLPHLDLDTEEFKTSVIASRKQQEVALEQMEMWSKREKETFEYAEYVAKQEDEWLETERQANETALVEMRSYVPANVAELSVHNLLDAASCQGGLMSLELASELKSNKLLQWLVMHPEDIAFANFLNGDKKTVFENIELLDIVEIRALAGWIPKVFELDNDGRKAEWRFASHFLSIIVFVFIINENFTLLPKGVDCFSVLDF